MSTPYPGSFPSDSITLVVNKLRGQDVPAAEAVHATWVVLGYGLGLGLPVAAQAGAGTATREQVADALEAAGKSKDLRGLAVPWGLVLAVLVQLLQELLKQQGG